MSRASLSVTTQGSIRRRLLFALLAGAAVLTVAVYFMVLSVARQVAQESQDNVLSASVISILDSARFAGGEVIVDLPYSALSMLGNVSDERVFYTIRMGDEFLSGYPDLPEAASSLVGAIGFHSQPFLGEDVRIATLGRPISTDTGQELLRVSVAQTLSGQQQIIARISRTSVAIGAGLFVLLVLLASLIARSTIQPLDRLAASVSRRGPEDLRPVAAPVPSEMEPLVVSLNSLMGRLQMSLVRSEDFIAEAAHRLRTPLAIVRTKAEIIARTAQDKATTTGVQEMIHAIDESSRTAGQLLDHAMVTFRLDNLSKEPIDLNALATATTDRVRPLTDLKDIEISVSLGTPVLIEGDVILLQNALSNLLDNAIKYAPSEARIDIEVIKAGDQAVLTVTDTGPGFPREELETLADRFARGSNATQVVGSGLGLTIVKEVMEAHGGAMTISNSERGGACVRLSFPSS
ncbi:sensor histidine kinase [Shimia ponticola]|uniref:sensor histidine kinase n=1 Tax=Shimia ponticola TaxID=2582893 RepID=UPI0011BD9987|nr:sensor histidine kinase [Shimia ponticola]